MLDLAIVEKLNRAGFVVAPYNTPVEVPNMPRNARFDCAAKIDRPRDQADSG